MKYFISIFFKITCALFLEAGCIITGVILCRELEQMWKDLKLKANDRRQMLEETQGQKMFQVMFLVLLEAVSVTASQKTGTVIKESSDFVVDYRLRY